jgi:PIN domain nuclease of toxin-antitoxin system
LQAVGAFAITMGETRSHASLWEITLKHGAGKLTLPDPPRNWWADQIAKWGIIELPLTAEALLRGSELPPHHKDPFDRVHSLMVGNCPVCVS